MTAAKAADAASGVTTGSAPADNPVERHTPPPPLFLRPQWYALFAEHIQLPGLEPLFVCPDADVAVEEVRGREQTRVAAQQATLPLWQRSGQRLTGRVAAGLSNYYSPMYAPTSLEIADAGALSAFVSGNARQLSGFDRIDLVPLYDFQLPMWQQSFAAIGLCGIPYWYSNNWYEEQIQDVDDYWSRRPSRLRNTVRRKQRRLFRDGEYTLTLGVPASRAELLQQLADYHHVYYDSWKQIEPFPAFIDAIVEWAWREGELRLGLIYHENVPVAAQIWFVCGSTAYIFKLAYRPPYAEQSVGTVLSAAMFDYVIAEDGVSCVDFLTGDDDYKRDWMSSCRPLYGLQLCNENTFWGQLYLCKHSLTAVTKKALGK